MWRPFSWALRGIEGAHGSGDLVTDDTCGARHFLLWRPEGDLTLYKKILIIIIYSRGAVTV